MSAFENIQGSINNGAWQEVSSGIAVGKTRGDTLQVTA